MDLEQELSNISSLISQIHGEASSFLDRRLKEEGLSELSTSHGYILFLLSESSLTMTEISTKIDKNKSTTSALVDKLEKKGYVTREKSPVDSRSFNITLSEKGKNYTERMNRISKELTEKFYTGFTEEEKRTVFTLLKKIQGNFG